MLIIALPILLAYFIGIAFALKKRNYKLTTALTVILIAIVIAAYLIGQSIVDNY